MRRLLILLIPALLLIILVIIQRAAAGLHYIVPAEPGALLYVTTFEAFTDEWQQYRGRLEASIEEGALRLRIDDHATLAFSYAAPHFADFDLTASVRAVEGPVDNGFGLVFRLQHHNNADPTDDDYYVFLISSDGYYRVLRVLDGRERVISDWIDSSAIRQGLGETNILRVIARGDTFQFFVNDTLLPLCLPDDPEGISTYALDTCIQGTMVDLWQDASIAHGQIGVAAYSTVTGGPGVIVIFDYLLVRGPFES
ncbi:MAG: hypothetical protein SNJ59_09230 [Aggregatilineales bacterium]